MMNQPEENRRDLQRDAKALATFQAISFEVTTPHDLPVLLRTIVENATELLNGTGGGLYLCDPHTREARCVVSHNTARDFTGTLLKYGEGAAGMVAETGQPLIIPDYRTWPGRSTHYEEEQPFRSILSVPMTWQNQVLGVIHVLHDRQSDHFTKEDLKLLVLFANQAAIAFQNAQMFSFARTRAQKLAILNDMTRASLEIGELDKIMQYLADQMRKLMQADGCYFTFWDETHSIAVPAAASGELKKIYTQIEVEPGELTMTQSVLDAGHTLIAEDAYETPYLSRRIAAKFPARSLLAMPMVAGGHKLGACLVAFNQSHKFTQDEIDLAEQAAAQIALALAKTRLLEAESHRADVLDSLRANVADISSILDLSDLLKIILGRAVTMLNAGGGDIGIYDEDKDEIEILVSHNMGRDYAGTRLASGEGAAGLAIRMNQMVVIEDYAHWEGRSPKYREGGWHATLAVPLIYRDRTIGALGVVDSNPDRRFSLQDQQLIGLFAQQVAIAVENARLYETEKRRAAELSILFEGSIAITNSIDLPTVLNTATEQLARAVRATSTHVLSFDQENNQAVVLAEHFDSRANEKERRSDLRVTYDMHQYPQTLRALLSREPFTIRLSDADIDPLEKKELSLYNYKSALDVPMIVSGRVIGFIEIWDSLSDREWAEEEIRVCQTLANQAAIALDNARVYDEMKRMAITDSLTGIYNRRGLFEMGQREISRVKRYNHPLTAIMLDIDHFKKINDAYSHAAGDQVLKELAQICKTNLRDIDILGRFGGEEFAILLPETECSYAYKVAERLRQIVADHPIATKLGMISISVSMGIACAHEKIEELAVLLDHADSAMYAAKEAGRNRVEVFHI